MTAIVNPLFAFFNLGAQEMIILLIIGVLLFGRKLPEVGRYLGKGIVEFKKGIKGLEDEVGDSMSSSPRYEQAPQEQPRPPQRVMTTAPKFEDGTQEAPRSGNSAYDPKRVASPKFEDSPNNVTSNPPQA
jgi:sec-independent protein translocase protein TatA